MVPQMFRRGNGRVAGENVTFLFVVMPKPLGKRLSTGYDDEYGINPPSVPLGHAGTPT
jgi:hypothetical protein